MELQIYVCMYGLGRGKGALAGARWLVGWLVGFLLRGGWGVDCTSGF